LYKIVETLTMIMEAGGERVCNLSWERKKEVDANRRNWNPMWQWV